MKDILKFIGVITLVFFSFFYAEKVIDVINEQDEIMIKLKDIEEDYKIASIDALIEKDTIIPGINGRKINIDKSYKSMKKIGIFNTNLLIYDNVTPNINLENNYDKYVIKGNSKFKNIAIIFKIKDDSDAKKLFRIIKSKNINVNFFVDYNYLFDNINSIANYNDYEFYSYGLNGKYNSDILLLSNNIINRKSNTASYCLSEDKSNNTLKVCSDNKMHTIYPSIINASYSDIKVNLENGSIISFDINNNLLNDLGVIIDYINSKGYKISLLSEFISEER